MPAAVKSDFISVKDYLASEEESAIRHEYLCGLVYGMAGETRDHNQISQNIASALRRHLQGGPCKVYSSDIRVNFHLHDDEYYYYPEIVVTCDRRDNDKRFVRHSRAIREVLSESTELVDKREKFFAYTSIGSLEEYALVEQSAREVTVFQRATGWKTGTFSRAKSVVLIPSLKLSLPLAAIYEGV